MLYQLINAADLQALKTQIVTTCCRHWFEAISCMRGGLDPFLYSTAMAIFHAQKALKEESEEGKKTYIWRVIDSL